MSASTIPVLDAAQAAQWDERARTAQAIPSRVLMEAAGRAVATVLARRFAPQLRDGVLVVTGHGNNGGDGWVVARALHAVGVRTVAAEAGGARSPDCEANRTLALAEGVELLDAEQRWSAFGLVVDALLGTGASGAPRGEIGALARRLAEAGVPIVAVDGPTGLDLSTGEAHDPCRADLTVTFGGVRRGHLLRREWCGDIVVADIGFPPPDPAWPTLFTDQDAARLLPPLVPDMHKGERGRVLVIGGAEGMAGAALHAASAAFAAGAGLVKIAAQPATVQAAQTALPDALTVTTALGPDLEPELAEQLTWADAVVLGPGLGRGPDRARFVREVLTRAKIPVVVDADALHAGADVLLGGVAPRVFTPHPGEFRAAFTDAAAALDGDRFTAADRATESRSGGPFVVLLKGVPTVIAEARRPLRVVATGNPALATGGSGDLLSGFIAAFLARRLEPLDAAGLGAWTLGRAAELASADVSVRATRPADVLAAASGLWRLVASRPAPEPPILVELPAPALV